MNNKSEIVVSSDEKRDWVGDQLISYNLQFVPVKHEEYYIPLNFHLRNEEGEIVAGVNSCLKGKSVLHVSVLWVDEKQRGHDYGSILLKHVEAEAKKLGCYLVFLDTYDFQAKGFYIKCGYEEFSVLEDSPAKGYNQYNFKKKI